MLYPGHSLGLVLPLCKDAVSVFYSPSQLGTKLIQWLSSCSGALKSV